MSKLRVLVLSHSEISNDPRIQRHIAALKSSFDVLTCSYGSTPEMVNEHFEISKDIRYLPRAFFQLIGIQLGLSVKVANDSAFTRGIIHLTDSLQFDAVLANDIHVLPAAFKVAGNKPVWADMHEYAPLEGDDDWRWRVAFKRYVKKICDTYLPLASIMTSVSAGICHRYFEDYRIPTQLVRNSHPFVERTCFVVRDSLPIRAVHVGAAIGSRKIDKMIEAFSLLPDTHTLDLYLIPTDKKCYEHIVSMVALVRNVTLKPPVGNDSIVPVLANYDLGVISLPSSSFNNLYSMPNKLFQYIQARLPIISGPLPEIERVINEFEIGWVTSDLSPQNVANALNDITLSNLSEMKTKLDLAATSLSAEKDNETRREIAESLFALA